MYYKNYYSNKKIVFLNSFLIFCIPLFLITGPFLSDFAISLITLIFLIEIIKTKKLDIFKNIYFLFFFLFWIYIVFNSLVINFDINALKISFFYFRFFIFPLAFYFALINDEDLLKKIFFSFLLCYILLIIDGYYQYFLGYNLLGFPLAEGPRVSSFFNDELILGSYLSRTFPVFFGITLYLFKKNKKIIFLSSFIFISIECLIFLSGERASFFYVNLSAIFIILFMNEFKLYRLMILILSFILILGITFINPKIKNRMIDVTIDQIGIKKEKKYIFSQEHHEQYLTAINIFKANPSFGVGIKKFKDNCHKKEYSAGKFSCSSHPHNIYLQFLSELGTFGFLFIFILIIYFAFHIIKHLLLLLRGKFLFNVLEISMLSAILITIWPFSPNGNAFNNWLNVIYFYPVGILFWSLKKNS